MLRTLPGLVPHATVHARLSTRQPLPCVPPSVESLVILGKNQKVVLISVAGAGRTS